MHSLAMAQDILEAVLSEAAQHSAKQVKAISVKIGDGHFTESDSLQFCLEALAKGTIAERAWIEIKLVGATTCDAGNLEMPTSEEPLQITLELD